MSAGSKRREKGTVVLTTGVMRTDGLSSSSDGDSDVDMETNFTLLAKRGRGEDDGQTSSRGHEESEGDSEEEEGLNEDDGQSEDSEEEEEEEEEEEDDDDDDDVVQSEAIAGGGDVQTEDDIKRELSTMSFEDIMKLQNKVGTKVYNQIAYGTKTRTKSSKKTRLNKNRPVEMSAKRPVPVFRQVIPVKKTILRDPRFDDLSGEYKPEIFEKTYNFINDIRQREKEIVKKHLKKVKKTEKKEKLQFLLKRMDNQERARKSREEQRQKELDFKRRQRELAGQGSKPFFLKKSEKRTLQLADKYKELKKSNKLENFLSKKRKRNATKDRRRLPQQN